MRIIPSNRSLKFSCGLTFVITALALFSCSNEESQQEAESDRESSEIIEAEFDQDWYTLEEAQKLAAHDEQRLQVFFYVDWCHYCRRMEEETYADEGVREDLYSWFYPVSINAESLDSVRFNDTRYTEEELAEKFGVTSFPTIVFIESDGEEFVRENGFIEAASYRQMLAFIGTHAYENQSFEEFTKN